MKINSLFRMLKNSQNAKLSLVYNALDENRERALMREAEYARIRDEINMESSKIRLIQKLVQAFESKKSIADSKLRIWKDQSQKVEQSQTRTLRSMLQVLEKAQKRKQELVKNLLVSNNIEEKKNDKKLKEAGLSLVRKIVRAN